MLVGPDKFVQVAHDYHEIGGSSPQLFRLDVDRDELTNLVEIDVERSRRLADRLGAELAALRTRGPLATAESGDQVELDEELEEELRVLGYVE